MPFAQMMAGSVQLLGRFDVLTAIGEPGINGPDNVLGSPLRWGKVNDPKGSARKVFRHAMKLSDPYTAGNVHRVDVMPPGQAIDRGATYWLVWDMLLPANTYSANDYTTLVNIHPSGSIGSVGVQLNKGRLQAVKQAELSPGTGTNTYWDLTSTSLADQWIQVAVKVRLASDSTGLLQVWVNGVQSVNDSGPNAAVAGGDYVKMAFYNYAWANGVGDTSRPEREMFYGQFHIVRDAGYALAQVQALLN